MVWNATLGGNSSPAEEEGIARAIKSLADELGCGVSFWTSNTPIDIGALELASTAPVEAIAPDTPPKKATKK